VLRRCASIVALVAVIAAPATTSTRFFCRYTGQEIVDCAEAAAPAQAIVRAAHCCDQRTFRPVAGVTAFDKQSRHVEPTLVGIAVAPELFSGAVAEQSHASRVTYPPSAGPPVFLSHRALLI
jgi:hypothetical protein